METKTETNAHPDVQSQDYCGHCGELTNEADLYMPYLSCPTCTADINADSDFHLTKKDLI